MHLTIIFFLVETIDAEKDIKSEYLRLSKKKADLDKKSTSLTSNVDSGTEEDDW